MLHSQTTLILAAVLFCLLPVLVLWTTAGQLREAVRWWCLGSALAGIALILMGLRPWIAPWASYQGGNTLLILSLVGWSQSLRLLLGRAWSWSQMGLWAVLALSYYGTLYSHFEPNTRGLWMRGLLGVLALYTGSLAWQLARQWRSHNAKAIAITYAVLGAGLLLQMLLHGGGGQSPSPFSNTWDASTIALLALMTAAVAHLGYTGLVIDQSARLLVLDEQDRVAIQERARLQQALRQNDRQTRLVLVSGSLAHELNQPLTAALTQAELAGRLLGAAPLQREALAGTFNAIEAAIERASRIVDRTRHAARAQPLQLRPVEMCEVMQGVIGLLQPEWQRLGVQLQYRPHPEALWCRGDELALSQLLLNVLRNATQALEASPRRQLTLICEADATGLRLRVLDSGPGVPAEVLERWGEPFVSTRREGLGLGLAISREIARQHGGQLHLANRPEGGTEVLLSLPLWPASQVQRQGAAP